MTTEATTTTERVRAYPPEAVLTVKEVAAWLEISTKTVYALPIKRVQVGPQTVRWLARHVYEFLEGKAA